MYPNIDFNALLPVSEHPFLIFGLVEMMKISSSPLLSPHNMLEELVPLVFFFQKTADRFYLERQNVYGLSRSEGRVEKIPGHKSGCCHCRAALIQNLHLVCVITLLTIVTSLAY